MDPLLLPVAPRDRLGIAIDAVAMRDLLDTDPSDRVRSVSIRRVFADRARGDVVLYDIERETSGSTAWFGRLVDDPQAEASALRERLAKDRHGGQESRSAPAVPLRILPDPGLILHPLGVDEALPGLGVLRKPWRLAEHLADSSIAQVGGKCSIALLAHRLGRRCVLRCRSDDDRDRPRSLIVKLFAKHERAERAEAQLDRLRRSGFGSGPIRAPKPLGTIQALCGLVMEDVPGDAFPEPLSPGRADAAFRAGEALAKLHQISSIGAKRHGAAEEVELLVPWCTLASRLRPELADIIGRCLTSVRRSLLDLRVEPTVLLHRDYYDRQVLLGERTTWLLDLDTQAAGPASLDLGNFLAHLDLADAGCGPRRIASLAETEAFLVGYGAGPRPGSSQDAVDVWRRAAQLRIACIHALTTPGRFAAVRLLRGLHERSV